MGNDSKLDWQPIETAPKDGTLVLAGRFVKGCDHDGHIAVDHWHDRRRNPKDTYDGFGRFNNTWWPATHWMPLPPPPLSTPEKPS